MLKPLRSFSHVTALVAFLLPGTLFADGGIVYRDIAAADGAGIDYRRAPSDHLALLEAFRAEPVFDSARLPDFPMKAHGAPGVALLDFDGDDDLDIFVTNGPGKANSLYSNQLRETGAVSFVDVAQEAGVDAAAEDWSGTCYGDTDNDGDADLLIVSINAPSRFFENQGDGTFVDVSEASGLGAGEVRVSSGCSFGDIDGDGLLDVAVGNTYATWEHYRGIMVVPFDLNQHNRLFRNLGDNTFEDVSAASGIEVLDGFLPEDPDDAATITWNLAFVDIDLDGDVDLVQADDQAGIPEPPSPNAHPRGMIHVLVNDGTGHFDDTVVERGLAQGSAIGAWMGLSFGDLDCNGTMDLFATNFGDYVPFVVPEPGRRPSRWFLQTVSGGFEDPGVGDLVTTPFGWGNAILDYDNDGDLDIVFHGGLDVGPGTENSNFGVVLQNPGCTAQFVVDLDAGAESTDHARRNVQGMAVGDLDQNGLLDVVTVSNWNFSPDLVFDHHAPLGSPFDDRAVFYNLSEPDSETEGLRWRAVDFEAGTLSVELAERADDMAPEASRSLGVRLLGTAGLLDGGRSNRDAIGAVARFWSASRPEPGLMLPVLGGSSYASQHDLALHFGLGEDTEGNLEILWPGGTKNRVYGIAAGDLATVPEIPCSFDDPSLSLRQYMVCVLNALDTLLEQDLIDDGERATLFSSAIKARGDALGDTCVVDGEFAEFEGIGALKSRIGTEGGTTYFDIAATDAFGITYRRTPSPSKEKFDAIKMDPPFTPDKQVEVPMKSWGAPGVAIFDYDLDGDLDIYAANGPGTANSLYRNPLVEGGSVFTDVGEAAGVAATEQDSTGVCFGDTDNDGDQDLLVLSHDAPHRFFVNQGDGTFVDATAESAIVRSGAASGCSMGDVDGDGLLDIVIANTYDNWTHSLGLNRELFSLNQHTQLFANQGGNAFADVSSEAGVDRLEGFPPENSADAGLTWAIALVDLDLDGDLDILNGDDQSGFPTLEEGGVDRGLIHLLYNDGTGHFTDVTLDVLGRKPGAWMGSSFGDYNCDGHLDFFGSNFGDFNPIVADPPGRRPSRWFLGNGDGTFSDPGVGALATTPFGWGTGTFDYDNDGDHDIVFHGGIDVGIAIEASNHGVVLRNPNCSGAFVPDFDAAASSGTDHGRRTVHGMAVGDLDRNGVMDIVTVSNFNIPEDVEMTPDPPLGSPFDPFARVHFNFELEDRGGALVWVGSTFDSGTLSVELGSVDNGNGSIAVRTVGTVGLTSEGRVNRDGIGAAVSFFPLGFNYPGVLSPVVGGASYASQDALERHFGTGRSQRGIVDVLWPGGVRNRLYDVRAGERLVFPEIPCGYDDATLDLDAYVACVLGALDELRATPMPRGESGENLLGPGGRVRWLMSALRARRHAQGISCEEGI